MRFKAFGTSWGERTVLSKLGRSEASNTWKEKVKKTEFIGFYLVEILKRV